MNTTHIATQCIEPSQLLSIIIGFITVVSEILPFIKNHDGNGLLHTIHCVLKSDCFRKVKLRQENDNSIETIKC
jgi:hypothetical protein